MSTSASREGRVLLMLPWSAGKPEGEIRSPGNNVNKRVPRGARPFEAAVEYRKAGRGDPFPWQQCQPARPARDVSF
ncbi:hypothetical protein NDU88_007277 [Pleurodeles waltl]|uniref:Uncharacterized protein n=1 Tax=Pleurodeles waltl TaxID=8319 RepID=A0AAV7URF3_PLEWA|nr:hypothetical protein NDU88_007277 [Pleurodeles waltl]